MIRMALPHHGPRSGSTSDTGVMRRAQAHLAAPWATSRHASMVPEDETDNRSSACAFRRFPRLALLSQP